MKTNCLPSGETANGGPEKADVNCALSGGFSVKRISPADGDGVARALLIQSAITASAAAAAQAVISRRPKLRFGLGKSVSTRPVNSLKRSRAVARSRARSRVEA